MISSIGSSTAYDFISASKPTAGIDAQIAHYKKELSDCVNCESAKTVKGKSKIQAIAEKITALTEQVDKAAKSKDTNQLPTQSATSSTNNASRTGRQYYIESFSDSGIESIGNNLNVFA